MTYLLLFLEFFKTGLFAIGGGLATLPFLQEMAVKYPWFTSEMLSDMIAISESTPGPIGVNMATYAGFTAGFQLGGFWTGVIGAAISTIALTLPSVIIIIIVSNFLKRFKSSRIITDVFYILRPAVTALIAAAGFSIIKTALFFPTDRFSASTFANAINLPAVILFALVFAGALLVKKIHPIVFILFSALYGILFKM